MENQQRLDEYQNKQKEEENKRKNRENLKKQKEEELRQKREKDANERRNKFLKKDGLKKNKKKESSDSSSSSSGSSSEEDYITKNVKTEPNQSNKNNQKNIAFQGNPFDKYKKNDSDDEESPIVKKKSKKKPSKTSQELPKKKASYKAKFEDFSKFREKDKNKSESDDDSDSSEEEEEKKDNNKKDEKPAQSKSIETKKIKKNSLYNKFNDYFFDEINEDNLKNKKSSNIKDTSGNQDKFKKNKGFYHYQNYPKIEEKSAVIKKFELVSKKTADVPRFNMDDNHIDNSRDNIKKKNKDKLKTKKFRKQNSNYYRKVDDNIIYDNENDLLSVRLKRGRNKNNQLEGRQNNSAAFNHDINIPKNMNNDIDINKSKVNQYKINAKKIRIAREKNKNIITVIILKLINLINLKVILYKI